MGGPNKLAATIRGRPLVRIAAEAAIASRAQPVVVVTGHEPETVRAALDGLDVRFVHNPDYADGLSTSLRRGIESLPDDIDGAVVLLADMPAVDATVVDRLIAAFDPAGGTLIVVPTFEGKRGNPVLWSRRLFSGTWRGRRRHRRTPPDRRECRRRRRGGDRPGGRDRRGHARGACRGGGTAAV